MNRYNALVDSFQFENIQPAGVRVRLELIGAGFHYAEMDLMRSMRA